MKQVLGTILFALVFFLSAVNGGDIMTPNLTPLTFPTLAPIYRDVYVDSSRGIFLVLTSAGLYQLDSDHQNILAFEAVTCSGWCRIRTELAASNNFTYVVDRTDTTATIWRYNVFNISNNVASYTFTNITGRNRVQLAIDPARKLAFAVSTNDPYVLVIDLIGMSFVNRFYYAIDTVITSSGIPAGWAIAIDSARALVYVGNLCAHPTPGYIRQFDVSDLGNVNMTNAVIFGGNPCFEEGFVEVSDGRAWFFEDDAAWTGGFAKENLNFGKDWTVPVSDYVQAFEYVEQDHTAFFIDQSDGNHFGSVYRTCVLEKTPGALHEIAQWASDSSAPCGSHWDAASRTLYVVSCTNLVTTITVGTTDCQLSPSNSDTCGSSSSSSSWRNEPFFSSLLSALLF